MFKTILVSWTSENFGSETEMPIPSHKQTKNITKIVKSLEDSGVLIEGMTKSTGDKTKDLKFCISLLGNTFTRIRVKRGGSVVQQPGP